MQALYIGGPTAILTIGGLRLMTDPTLDPAGHSYPSSGGKITLDKMQSPATTAIGKIDVILLSHDQHPDNLDTAGRALLPTVTHTYTTVSGAQRLGGNSIGHAPWDSRSLTTPDGSTITVTATPARHGPAGIDPMSGEVIGFVLSVKGRQNYEVYVTGDTVFYEGVAEVARKFKPGYIFLFAGAARTRGPFNLTMSANDAIDTAAAFPTATIIPLHYEGWRHFTQNQADLETSFAAFGIGDRLKILPAGVEITL